MTTCTDASPAFDDEALRRPSVRSPARRAHQAKAKPSLQIYDNNGNVIGYWTSRNLVSPVTRNFPT